MPKGHKKSLNIQASLLETDRALAYAMRKNLGTAQRLLQSPIEEIEKAELKAYIEGHALAKKQPPPQAAEHAPKVITVRERFLERVVRVLAGLSEPNLRNLYELAKSMGRVERSRESDGRPRVRSIKAQAQLGNEVKDGDDPSVAEANAGS